MEVYDQGGRPHLVKSIMYISVVEEDYDDEEGYFI